MRWSRDKLPRTLKYQLLVSAPLLMIPGCPQELDEAARRRFTKRCEETRHCPCLSLCLFLKHLLHQLFPVSPPSTALTTTAFPCVCPSLCLRLLKHWRFSWPFLPRQDHDPAPGRSRAPQPPALAPRPDRCQDVRNTRLPLPCPLSLSPLPVRLPFPAFVVVQYKISRVAKILLYKNATLDDHDTAFPGISCCLRRSDKELASCAAATENYSGADLHALCQVAPQPNNTQQQQPANPTQPNNKKNKKNKENKENKNATRTTRRQQEGNKNNKTNPQHQLLRPRSSHGRRTCTPPFRRGSALTIALAGRPADSP